MKFLGTHCPERVQGTTCECLFNRDSFKVRSRVFLVSIVVSIPACHAGDRGSIPRRGDYNTTFFRKEIFLLFGFVLLSWILPCWLISVFTEQATPFWWKPTAAISLREVRYSAGVQSVPFDSKYSEIVQYEFSFVNWGDGDVACTGTALRKVSVVPKFWCTLE